MFATGKQEIACVIPLLACFTDWRCLPRTVKSRCLEYQIYHSPSETQVESQSCDVGVYGFLLVCSKWQVLIYRMV